MVNSKGQTKKPGETKVDEKPVEEEPEVTAQVTTNPLDEVLGQAQKAYSAYMDATREVSRIYRENEIQVGEAYMRAVQQATAICDSTIKQATKDRELAEKKARETYEKALEEAEKKSEETVADALKTREEDIAKAWELREETVAQAWDIYSKVVR